MAPVKSPSMTIELLNQILTQVKGDLIEVKQEVKLMGEAISKLVSVEQRQTDQNDRIESAFHAITSVSDRLTVIEHDMPGLKETRRWVVHGILTVCGVLGLAVIGLVLAPKYQAPALYGSTHIVPGTAPSAHQEAIPSHTHEPTPQQ